MGVSSCRKNRKNKNYSFGKNLSKMKGGWGGEDYNKEKNWAVKAYNNPEGIISSIKNKLFWIFYAK